jgi:hypothetical protein
MEIARVQQAERMELLAVLPPDPFYEYLLRYSPTAQRLRDQTHGLILSPDQFRGLFSAVDPIVTQPDFYYQGNEAALTQRQQTLQAQYDRALRDAIGDENYNTLQLNQDPLYLSASAAAQQASLPSAAVAPLYEINRATQAELNRVRNDSTLTDSEKIDALASTRAEEQKSVEQLLGPDAFKRWLATQTKP